MHPNPDNTFMDPEKLRAWWAARQGLDGSLREHSAEDVLSRAGWSRSVGGAGPYLTLFARAGLGRVAIDDAVAQAKIHELPAARGCTYVVPEADYAVALMVGQQFSPESEMRLARKFGVTDKEIDKLRAAARWNPPLSVPMKSARLSALPPAVWARRQRRRVSPQPCPSHSA